ncbi:hypothetical protein B0H10DRAFT_1940568 [Mycena sp. CBHHK59/15]|nr:hypothetical protein B0H10DRAFT_1940568 [Mycena sp. CBHHK59/15]
MQRGLPAFEYEEDARPLHVKYLVNTVIRAGQNSELRWTQVSGQQLHKSFKQWYLQLCDSSAGKPQAGPTKKSNSTKMRCSIVIEEDDDSSVTAESHVDPLKPGHNEYELYFNMQKVIPEGMDTIKWWGGEMDGDVDENSWDSMLHEDPDNYDPDYDMES